jgi:hypothetical protein
MDISHLAANEIMRALAETNEALASIRRYQAHLLVGYGLPGDMVVRSEPMQANMRSVEVLKNETNQLEAELIKRFGIAG